MAKSCFAVIGTCIASVQNSFTSDGVSVSSSLFAPHDAAFQSQPNDVPFEELGKLKSFGLLLCLSSVHLLGSLRGTHMVLCN